MEELIDIEKERQLIQRAYRNLLKTLKSDLTNDDRTQIRLAYELAVDAHSKQRRKSGEPYILHPIEVARICTEEIGLGPTAVICALLHDVVEDTDITLAEINEKFGLRVATIVDGLTKLDGVYDSDNPQAENFKKVLSTLVDDVRVVLIKMADRLHNMRTLGSMPRHKQLKIAAETSVIYAPLAHRLGLYNIKSEFQDLSLKINEPELYNEIIEKLTVTKAERDRYINDFIKPLTYELDEIEVPYRITGRPKSISSIANKIKTKQVPFEEIYDLFAVRIIVDTEEGRKEKLACWQVYSIVTDVYKPIPERLKDWVTTPKSNGYESLHTTVIGIGGKYVEVQIRSERMDEIAERGFAAHWKYKGVSNQQDVYDAWLDSVRELLEDQNGDAIEFLQDFKTNLFNEEVYAYTPKGDMIILPKGATALDFAFSIHTDVGYHCMAIKVENKLVPMSYKLQNGDQISIITNKNQKPNEDWLKMVVTGKARSKIRSALKEDLKKQGLIGKEMLERKLENMKIDFDESVDTLVKFYGFQNRLDLYYAITINQVDLLLIKQLKVDNKKLILPEPEHVTDFNIPVSPKNNLAISKAGLLIGGDPAEKYQYSLANCCNPVQGDDIFAYVSMGGMKIHRNNCPNAANLMSSYSHRILKAEWENKTNNNFVTELMISGIDDGPGVIERLTTTISSNLGLNIRSFNIKGEGGYFEGKISLMVLNTDQLQVVIRTLKALKNVSNVTRMEG
ncbi:MAG: bifunctional (p)ppGpp synthetase/guanosine-3',5'-bis(diphosphate) 3'-pyrophosphohydrolase [Saprospiraceae bacterium]|nr:bifunctional (p)ppGpp synthetase/guanosine-3',5'-bis(diphosphate) 3'-pyrophosphohydrolase [Saprospiraceae bacterium]